MKAKATIAKQRSVSGPSRRRRAFTLLELILVLTVIAVIAGASGTALVRNGLRVAREQAAFQRRELVFAAQHSFRLNFADANDQWGDAFDTEDRLQLLIDNGLLEGTVGEWEEPAEGFELEVSDNLRTAPTLSKGDTVY